MREVMKLARAFRDVLFQLRVMCAQLRFGSDHLVGHGVDRFGERVDLGGATARRAGRAIARRELSRGVSQPASRARDADHQHDGNNDDDAQHCKAGATEHALRLFCGTCRVLRGGEQGATRGGLQFLVRAGDERRAFVEELATGRPIGRVEFLDQLAQAHGVAEVFPQQVEPRLAG